MIMKIALGGDSAGKPLIDVIEAHLKSKANHQVTNLSQPGFYADLSATVAIAVKEGKYERAILCCGTGIGVCISANKVSGIRAALTHDTYSAERAAKSNNAQIITMGARVIGPELAKAIVDSWLASEFDPKGSSAANVDAINRLDDRENTVFYAQILPRAHDGKARHCHEINALETTVRATCAVSDSALCEVA
jgi:RpiB/LacA/LacB family sugar-phosphate isomerase